MTELEDHETVKRWLSGVQADHTGSLLTRRNYLRSLKRFVDWIGKNPDQLVEERKRELKSEDMTVKRRAEETLKRFSNYLEGEKGLSRKSVLNYHGAVRSFYAYNYCKLELKTPKAHAVRGVSPHSHEELRKIHEVCNTRDKAILLVLCESGMSREDAVKLTYSHVKQDYEKESDIIHMAVVRQKEQISYDTFIGVNGSKALRAYLEMRKRKGERLAKETPLFRSVKENKTLTPMGLSLLFERLGQKSGITTSPHRLRKFFESNMGTKAPSLLVRYWMGHSLGVESSYFVPSVEEQRKAYLEAYDKIDIFRTELSEVERRKKTIEDMARLLPNMTQEKFEMLRNLMAKAKSVEELDKTLRKFTLRPPRRRLVVAKKKEKEDCENGKNCQKIISESDLEQYLAKGYRFVSVLPSGKVVVED